MVFELSMVYCARHVLGVWRCLEACHHSAVCWCQLDFLVHLIYVVCDHVVDRSGSLCEPIFGLGYISYVHLNMYYKLGLVLNILYGYHMLIVG